MTESKLVLPQQEEKENVVPEYESLFRRKVFKLQFKGERLEGLATLTERIRFDIIEKFSGESMSKSMQKHIANMKSLYAIQAESLTPTERAGILKEIVLSCQKIINEARLNIQIEYVQEPLPAEVVKEDTLSNNVLHLQFQQQLPIIQR